MRKKKIIIIVAAVALLILVVSQVSKNNGEEYQLTKVVMGTISQTVSETGQVQKGDKINLSFKSAGVIEKIYTTVGQVVARGTTLAKLDTSDFSIQLEEAKASLAVYQADLNKLVAGPIQEEIKTYQTAVNNKQIALDTAEQDLEDENEDALNDIDDAYLKSYNAKNTVDSVQRAYFVKGDQLESIVKSEKVNIEEVIASIKSYLDAAKNYSTQDNIDAAVSKTEIELANVSESLKIVREACEDYYYRNIILAADKTSLDTHRTNINTAITSIADTEQAIAAAKLAVLTAQGNLQAAKDDLALLIAPARAESLVSAQNKVSQAQAQVDILEKKISDGNLKSPVSGQVAEINKRVGEQVLSSSQDTIFVIIPNVPYEIEVDIYEEDVVKLKEGNQVLISLVAFPGQTFSGKLISIDPAEKIVDGVVYYNVVVGFEEVPEGIKPGMSADIVIIVLTKENVLMVSEDALENGGNKVLVLVNNKATEKTIETGLVGSDGMVEIISGLEEGEEVILR